MTTNTATANTVYQRIVCPTWCTEKGKHTQADLTILSNDTEDEFRLEVRHAGPNVGPFALFAETNVHGTLDDSYATYAVDMDTFKLEHLMKLTAGSDAERLRKLAAQALEAAAWIEANTTDS